MNHKACFLIGMAVIAPIVTFADLLPANQDRYPATVFEEEHPFFDNYIKNRLHIGLSYVDISMDKKSTPHDKAYLGNLDRLSEEDTDQIGIMVKYDFCKYAAVLFAYDMNAELAAWNWGSASSDGALKLKGYTLQAIGQYPIEIVEDEVSIIPYLGLGFSDISAKWDHANWWHWGWSSPESYNESANGSTSPHNGYSRWMVPEDPPLAFTYSIGVTANLYSHLDIDLFYRVVDLDDVETDFRTGSSHGHLMIHGAFPAKFSAYGIALRYVF